MSLNVSINGLAEYTEALDQYIKVSKRDIAEIITKKGVSLRLTIMRGLRNASPGKSKVKADLKRRGYKMKIKSKKALRYAGLRFSEKSMYLPLLEKEGIVPTKNMMKLKPSMLARMLANVAETKARNSARGYLASTMKVSGHKNGKPENAAFTNDPLRNHKLPTSITIKTLGDKPFVHIQGNAVGIGKVSDRKAIVTRALLDEKQDMLEYINNKLAKNKQVFDK